ncbi:MAG: leucine-rich repeat domain-containing protein [Agathobacter sp.]|nr:leucine-rich repeat domain-containing protein [Agathobacter sp.]
MQRIKRMLAYILAFAMVFTALPQNAYVYATETNNEERGTIVEGQTVTASNATDSNATNPNADSPIVSVELESKPVSEYIFQCQTKTGYGMNSDKIFNGLKLKVTFVNDTSQTTEIDSIGETRFVYYKTGTMGAGTPFSVNFKGWEKMEDGYANLGDNAAIFNVGGKEYSLPVKISEDPVKEMTIIKNPEKIQYEPFKENIADLYGAEIKIVYKDNKEEVVKITEHDNYVETIGRYGFSLYSSINTNPSQLSLNVYYINESCPVNISVSDIASAIDDTLTDSIWISHQVQDKKSKLYKVEPQNDITYHAFLLSGSMTINVYNQYLPYKLDYLSQNEPVSISLEGGKTYYIVTSSSMGNDAIAYVTNNENLSRNDIKISSYGISDIPAAHRYTFEDSIYANFGIELQGTAYYITYSAENTEYTSYGVFGGFYQLLSNNQYSLHGMPLSLKWKKTEMRYGAEYVTVSNDNAIIYNWGGKEAEIPASFDKETPVESITIIKNPFVDKVFYGMNAYQEMQKYLSEILFQINYKDGTKSEELSFQDNSQSAYIDGYIAQLTNISTSIGINCAKLTYMGCEADVEYEVGEIPIKDIKFSKAPNNIYICFPLGATLDLFGAEITIEYLDDTSENVKVESHGTSITFEGKYGYGSIWANYMFGADNTAPIILSYMQETITTSTYIEAVSVDEYLKHVTLPELSVGEIQFSPKQNGNSVLYEFVPEETAEYTISWQDTNPMYSSIKSMYIRNSSCVVLASAFSPTTSCSAKLEAGKVYYISLSGGSDCIFTFSRGKVITQNIIPSVSINSSEMNIGDALPNLSIPAEDEGYTIVSEKWNTSDTTVNGASVYKATIVLTPNENYKFTRDTVAEFKIGDLKKGKVTKSLSTNGNLTLVCTYLKTPSVITFKGDSGKYVLANPQKNTVENNGDYVFKYIASQDAIDTQNIIIKVDGNIISPVELNYNDPLATDTNATSGKVYMYTIPNVTNNKEVAVKIIDKNSSTDNANVKVDLYNKGQNEGDKYDSIEVKKGDSISQNESDNKLPVLQSYNGDNNFFFGWYMEIASGGNGKGQRFLSTTEVNNNTKIYARWENGIFEFGSNPRTQYKITSIDENNNMKVELIKYSINLARLTAGVTAYTIANLTATEDNIANIPDSISAREALANYDIAGNMEIASIGEGAFEGSNVTKIELPNTVEKIEANAFKGCTSLESIALPETIETIEAGTFDGCTSLKTVEIPEGVTSIGEDVFKGCTSLKTVSIPDTVESIAETAFDNGNSSLPITVVCSDETAEIVKNAASEKVNVLSVNLSTNVDSLEFSKHSKRFNVTPYLEVKNGETTLDNNNYDITHFCLMKQKRLVIVVQRKMVNMLLVSIQIVLLKMNTSCT